mmetsp:Transcript_8381/g.20776  ORF Transcript_8381/g.20776 Transcript_8381/m.20776 type:complete len:513 (+) Transcript_8381:89-1627(+)
MGGLCGKSQKGPTGAAGSNEAQLTATKTVGGHAVDGVLAPGEEGGPDAGDSDQLITTFTTGTLIFENPNRAITTDYTVDNVKQLGEGGYGVVVMGTNKATGAVRAVKKISKKRVRNLKGLRQEIEVMKMTDHPNIVKLYETYEDSARIYLVMECCEGGELFDKVLEAKRFDERQTAICMRQLLRAVRYLHDMQMVHRDLKPENLIFVKKKPVDRTPMKVIDFGLAQKVEEGVPLTSQKGSQYYIAPEVLKRSYGLECDMWSCGVIMFILLSGYPPFYGADEDSTYVEIKKGTLKFRSDYWAHISQAAKDLIAKMCQKDVNARIVAKQAVDDPWIQQYSKSPNCDFTAADLERLCSFFAPTRTRLAQTAYEVIVLRLSELDVKPMKDLFLTLDADGDGYITKAEVEAAIQKNLSAKSSEDAVGALMKSLTGRKMTYTEFLAAVMDKTKFVKENTVKAAFLVFDRGSRGKVSSEDLSIVFGATEAATITTEANGALSQDAGGAIDVTGFTKLLA